MKFFTKTELRIFLIFWIIFSVFTTSDRWLDNSSLALTMAIVDEHRFEIDSYADTTGDKYYINGHFYPDRVPGMAFLTIPIYGVYKFFLGEIPGTKNVQTSDDNYYNGQQVKLSKKEEANYRLNNWKYLLFLFLVSSLISAVFGALTIVLVYKASKYFTSNKTHRNLVIIVLGLGTLLVHAGRQVTSHAASTFFIFLCFYLILKMKKEKTDFSFIAGLAGGLAILMEYRTIIVLIGLFILVLASKKWSWILKFTAGVLAFYSILLLYNNSVYCSSFEDFYSISWHRIAKTREGESTRCFTLPSEFFQRLPRTTPLLVLNRFNYPLLGTEVFKSDIKNVMRLLFDPFKGLFFYSPIMLLSFIGLFFMHKRFKLESLIIFFCFLIYIFQIGVSRMWWIGHCFGPRLLTPIIPFFTIPLLYSFKKLNIKIVLFFITISILINTIGLQSVHLSHSPITENNPNYCERMKSFLPLANPLFENYIPSFLNYNPPNPDFYLVLERLLNFKIIPFANILLLLFSFLLIWKNEFIFKE